MKTILIGLAASTMLVASPALAQGNPNPHNPNIQDGGNGNGNNGCGNGNGGNDGQGCGNNGTPGNPGGNGGNGGNGGSGGTGGNGGTGGAGGNGTGIGVGIGVAGAAADARATAIAAQQQGQVQGQVATGGDASAVGTGGNATALGFNSNDNRSNATGGTALATGGNVGNTTATGGTGGSAVAAGGAGGNSGGNTFSNTTNYRRAFRTAPMAYAPSVIAGECQRSSTWGISTPVGGISRGKTKGYKFCETLKLRSVAAEMSLSTKMQCAILSQDKRWARAMRESGETCATVPVVVVPQEPVVVTPSTVADNG